MTREEYLRQQQLPDWMKDFKKITDDFFNESYIKPKDNTIIIIDNGEITPLD